MCSNKRLKEIPINKGNEMRSNMKQSDDKVRKIDSEKHEKVRNPLSGRWILKGGPTFRKVFGVVKDKC